MITELKISRCDVEIIHTELEANKPYEACGVLVGTISGSTALVEKALHVTNVKRTRTSFELDPKEHYGAWNDAEKNGKEIVGVYHTHPVSSAVPSLWDRETMQNVPGVWVIAGADGMRAYVWENGIKAVRIKEC
ncbi:MAG: M67 family metallopeptidase [Euryarchaeota archaeon]|nr:M67 family metallopeptidase [Euryarchaeota archaeon]MBU4491134.1 M67 family metallopeptidase [Euryarchaeota archaeon]MCG2727992.1 M67 family metallopeptidase [Candidatus Methanoperedenaceae archaeon]